MTYDPKNSLISLRTLELATVLWYGKVDLNTANKAEIRLMNGETFNKTDAVNAHGKYMREEMRKILGD